MKQSGLKTHYLSWSIRGRKCRGTLALDSGLDFIETESVEHDEYAEVQKALTNSLLYSVWSGKVSIRQAFVDFAER